MTAYLGIDVGTGSARAGVFDASGLLLGSAQQAIQTWRPQTDFVQQSSADIWGAVIKAVRRAVSDAGIDADRIAGVGFDATCSLVVVGQGDAPLSIDPNADPSQDVIVWMDHRAVSDANAINAIGGAPLKHVGGRISPEMQVPKLRWLKHNMPDTFSHAESFWDLPDWLVHRATGAMSRSLCSMVCKWTYLAQNGLGGEGWDDTFLTDIGLSELTGDGHKKIGAQFLSPGQKAGGLHPQAASELGLEPGTPVAASLIDAHAGALGTLGVGSASTVGRLAMIAGTSNCHIGLMREPVFVPGVWGPYFGAVLPGFWVNEGGQTAAGALIDAVLARHAATATLQCDAKQLHAALDARLAALGSETAILTARRHILPDFHGNRSPLAEPWRLGGITGLSLDTGPDDLALDYLAAVQAVCYGTRHIIEAMQAAGQVVHEIVVSGGMAKSRLFLRELADICDMPVLLPETDEPVLLGTAILATVAAGHQPDLKQAMQTMAPGVEVIRPRGGPLTEYHRKKYQVYRLLQNNYAEIEDIMGRKDA